MFLHLIETLKEGKGAWFKNFLASPATAALSAIGYVTDIRDNN